MGMAFRILITGSRDWTDEQAILDAIIDAAADKYAPEQVTIVHGACPTGADALADRIARRLGCKPERHPADWQACTAECRHGLRRTRDGREYCPQAGHRRNQEMVDLGAHVVLAFQRNQSRGTQDCVDRARAAGLTVVLKEEQATS